MVAVEVTVEVSVCDAVLEGVDVTEVETVVVKDDVAVELWVVDTVDLRGI